MRAYPCIQPPGTFALFATCAVFGLPPCHCLRHSIITNTAAWRLLHERRDIIADHRYHYFCGAQLLLSRSQVAPPAGGRVRGVKRAGRPFLAPLDLVGRGVGERGVPLGVEDGPFVGG